MRAEPAGLCRAGAWGQVVVVGVAIALGVAGATDGFLATCLGYVVVTAVGILGISRAESAIAGPLAFPFLIPGFVPLYYFATR